MVNGLYRMYLATANKEFRLVVLELCLSVPSRLSVLLPHLPLLIRVVPPALRSNHGDLVNLR